MSGFLALNPDAEIRKIGDVKSANGHRRMIQAKLASGKVRRTRQAMARQEFSL